MKLGKKIRQFGEEKFASNVEFAKALKIKREQLYPYFQDRVIPGGEILRRLYDLGCDIHWLLADKKPPKTKNNSNVKVSELSAENKILKSKIKQIEKILKHK
jgi:transcriptional regulator with XRE-family HTH domain